MSVESDDEFAVLQLNTPNVPRKIAQSTAKPSGGNYNHNRVEAGPSRAVNNVTSNKRKKGTTVENNRQSDKDELGEIVWRPPSRGRPAAQTVQEDVSEGEAVVVSGEESGSNEVEEIIDPPTIKVRGGSRKPARTGKALSSTTNGNTKAVTAAAAAALAKGKGKQKAASGPKNSSRREVESMDVDVLGDDMDVEDAEHNVAEEEPVIVQPVNMGRFGKVGKFGKVQHLPLQNQKKDEQFSKLQKQLQQAQDNIKDLNRQLDELCQVRKTEAEQLLERMETQHQAQIQAKDSLLADLNVKVAKSDPVLKSGNKSAFELLTRDEANEEMRNLQEQIKKYRDIVQQRDQHLKQQQKDIDLLKEDKRMLEIELKEEVRRAQELVARAPPPSVSRPRAGGVLGHSQDPKYAQIITFYEDLTNVIVPNMKVQTGKYLDLEEWILNCCYTHKDVVNKNNSSPKSCINFNLRLGYEPRADAPNPVTRKDDLVPSVFYTPLELQNESKEFIESLEFLGGNFTFERDQLSLFVRTLHDYVSGEGGNANNEDEEESNNSVEIVE